MQTGEQKGAHSPQLVRRRRSKVPHTLIGGNCGRRLPPSVDDDSSPTIGTAMCARAHTHRNGAPWTSILKLPVVYLRSMVIHNQLI